MSETDEMLTALRRLLTHATRPRLQPFPGGVAFRVDGRIYQATDEQVIDALIEIDARWPSPSPYEDEAESSG